MRKRALPSPLVGEGGRPSRELREKRPAPGGRMRGAGRTANASFLPTPLFRLGAARRSTFSHRGRRKGASPPRQFTPSIPRKPAEHRLSRASQSNLSTPSATLVESVPQPAGGNGTYDRTFQAGVAPGRAFADGGECGPAPVFFECCPSGRPDWAWVKRRRRVAVRHIIIDSRRNATCRFPQARP